MHEFKNSNLTRSPTKEKEFEFVEFPPTISIPISSIEAPVVWDSVGDPPLSAILEAFRNQEGSSKSKGKDKSKS